MRYCLWRLTVGQRLVSVGLILSAVTISSGCQSPVNEVSRIAEVEHGLLPFTAISGEPGMDLLERMQKYQVPGVSIAVIDGGEIQWIKHYGVTDVRQPLPVDDTTLFNVGSMSKAVTSAIILSLVRDGLIDLNAPVNQQLRSWQLPENDLMRRRAGHSPPADEPQRRSRLQPGLCLPYRESPNLSAAPGGRATRAVGPSSGRSHSREWISIFQPRIFDPAETCRGRHRQTVRRDRGGTGFRASRHVEKHIRGSVTSRPAHLRSHGTPPGRVA